MNRNKWLVSIILLAVALVGGTLFLASQAVADNDPGLSCQHQGLCATPGCLPIPTSLPTANGGPVGEGVEGWKANGSRCGTKSCYILLRCPCGSKLSTDWCYGCAWPPPCV